jgi:folate-binding protein YgfZ
VSGCLLFELAGRGVIAVRGDDRTRWLDGMVSCDVKSLAPGAGAHGLLLTPQGRIVAELHVLARADELWLETEASAIAGVLERLRRYVIADDVVLSDLSGELARLGLEGAGAGAVLAAAGGGAGPQAPHAHAPATLAGHACTVARYGFGPQAALQLFVPRAGLADVAAALAAAGAERADAAALERLRVEAGTPWPGRELDESVLPAEVRLDERAVSVQKGCYTGQEVVARMRSRGRVGHLLVGLRLAQEVAPQTPLEAATGQGAVGAVTSVVCSERFGPIALGFVKADLARPGVALTAGGVAAEVTELPFAPRGA